MTEHWCDTLIDKTHDPARQSWVESANGHSEFPIQNLPFGVFSPPGGEPRGGVAIGDFILDLRTLAMEQHLGLEPGRSALVAGRPTLNAWMGLTVGARRLLRQALSHWLTADSPAQPLAAPLFWRQNECTLHLPATIGDYSDFYAGIHHAENVGRLFRPDAPLLPNYKYVPLGYHGRSSSIVPSPSVVRRPIGQIKPSDGPPVYKPTERLDYEVELGLWLGASNAAGETIPIEAAFDAVAGVCLLNDWSARDIQAWEYQPLGPFLAKSFMTTISPWVITTEALAPFRTAQRPRPDADPAPLPHLYSARDQKTGALGIEIDIFLSTAQSRATNQGDMALGRCDARDLYWTAAQLVAHHASNGCPLRPGDLLGTGTISGTEPNSVGSLLERTKGGKVAIPLPGEETLTFLQEADIVTFKAHCRRDGFVTIGFGSCAGRISA